jgi:hypothetical protein
MRRLFGMTTTLLALTAGPALAGGPYLGFHAGSVGVDVRVGDSLASLQSTDFAWKGFGGVALGRFLAVETGYVSFGTADDSVGGVALQQKLWGWDTAGLVKLNLGPVDIYGRMGGIYWKADASAGGPSVSTDGFDVNYGGGLGVVLGKLEVRGEYVWYDINSAGKPWMASAGLTLSF